MALTAASRVKISIAVKPNKLDVRPAQHRSAKAYTETSKNVTIDYPPMLQHVAAHVFSRRCMPCMMPLEY